jgi:cyclase
VLVVRDGIVVQSIGFNRYLPVGRPEIATEFLSDWGADEIVLLDISASREERGPDYAMVRDAARKCRVPLAVGGGITRIQHVAELIRCGADKVCVNRVLFLDETFVSATAHVFGGQCMVGSIDACLVEKDYRVYDYLRGGARDVTPVELARKLQEDGIGEIFINSVDRDGSYAGFDLELVGRICEAVSVPVICCGGAGQFRHFVDAFEKTGVSAAAAANMLHFIEHSVITLKAMISSGGVLVRQESSASYAGSMFDKGGRLLKKDDAELENMRFIRIEKETI